MPLTFLAHQLPVLPFTRSRRVDGVALVLGSMAPDFLFVLAPYGIGVNGHRLPYAITAAVPAAMVASWIVVHVLARVVPDHLPASGFAAQFALDDYRGLATHRFRPVWFAGSAALGVASHVALDHFTHDWGFVARSWRWWREPVATLPVAHATITPVGSAQYVLSFVLGIGCIIALARRGRAGWFRDPASRVERFAVSRRTHSMLWSCTGAGMLLAVGFASALSGGRAALVLSASGGAFAGLGISSLLLLRTVASGGTNGSAIGGRTTLAERDPRSTAERGGGRDDLSVPAKLSRPAHPR